MTIVRGDFVVGVAALCLALAGCGGGHTPAPVATQHTAGRAPDSQLLLVTQPGDVDRQVISTADLVVRVGKVGDATRRAQQITHDAGGLVFALDSNLDGGTQARVTLKVPPDRFDGVVDTLAALGRALQRQVKAQDVTEDVVDLSGRLKSATASADRLRGLLGQAKSAADVVALEGELAKRESDIESMQGKLRVLSSQVELATINLRLTERSDLQVSDNIPSFARSLHAGWVVFVNIGLAIVVAVGFALPFTPVALAVLWWVRRRRVRSA